jgi:hypothetical protein
LSGKSLIALNGNPFESRRMNGETISLKGEVAHIENPINELREN